MSWARADVLGRVIAAALGLAVTVASAALAQSDLSPSAAGTVTTYGGVSISFALLELAVGVGLALVALLLLAQRSTALLGVIAMVAGAAWFTPVWLGWDGGPQLVRGLGQVASPQLAGIVLLATVAIPAARAGAGRRVLIALTVALLLVGVATAVALARARDPLRDLYCWSDCTVTAFVRHDDEGLAHRLTTVLLGIAGSSGVAAALIGVVRVVRSSASSRRTTGPALVAAGVAGAALAAYALALHEQPQESPGRPLYSWLFVARALSLLVLAGALGWLALRPRLVRGRVTRLVVDLERSIAEGGLDRALANALGDPGLRLAYPIGSDDQVVDASGRPVALDQHRRVTPIVAGNEVVALVESDTTSAAVLGRELGTTAQLALGNERLRAEALARLADVTASRARIVETADTTRRRIERDLHDGAQQQMLALTADLRVALTIAETSGDTRASVQLRKGLAGAIDAAEELRDIAHGIFPAELAASGLQAALESLSDLQPLTLTARLAPRRRYPAEIETAAYAVVAEATDSGASVGVILRESADMLHVILEADTDWRTYLVRFEDRVGSAGGIVDVAGQRLEVVFPAPLPR